MDQWVAALAGLDLLILWLLLRALRRIRSLESSQKNWTRRITDVHKKIDESLVNQSKPRR